MANIRKFEDLKVWQKAHQLVLMVYKLTSKFPPEEKYGLSSQKRRAVVSVASNIVEGFKRRTVKDSLNFYNTADASLEELRYQTLLSKDLGYISEIEYIELIKLEEEVSKMLNSWIKSQKGNSA
ncbi:four helix bundle protein [Candidatus Nomurabacteria bacterium RIFCSPLOWO2_01_FULL_42_20]|uniref:Four helix bundle protein n=1 Tax=Candidatus Nomurabacteria bacterium RIFCSPHIGHO2_01_FULL_42_16 TaxID=1801743 RepID=A0A1F6VIY1_9BACT|nr:MAG: four helix bundle protein [Candidatus Nomurabacteria bacterium RIFCSPHIGHO2_01_FULL_42_16]OGI91904.1 MAG: four helix bundle protein [Candidatus Nomurabacteria bacterium RIFCSPLOWO2_01_FULL_42_20]